MYWEIPNQLARSSRPGYAGEDPFPVTRGEVDEWLNRAATMGIKSIICLLADDQLGLYTDIPEGLVSYYEAKGFAAASIPVRDHQYPPMTERDLEEVWNAYSSLPKPVLIHCSAGMDRTGAAVTRIRDRLTLDQQ